MARRRRWLITTLIACCGVAACGSGASSASWPTAGSKIRVPDDYDLTSMAWRPDGSSLAVLGEKAAGRVFIVSKGRFKPLTAPDKDIGSFGWMPGGRSILAAEEVRSGPDPDDIYAPAQSNLVEIDLGGRLVRTVALKRPLLLRYGLAVNSGGDFVIAAGGPPGRGGFDFDPQLFRIDLASGAVSDLPNPEGAHLSGPQFTGDQRVVAFADGEDDKQANDRDHLVVVDLPTGTSHRLTPPQLHPQGFSVVPGTEDVVYRAWDTPQGSVRHALWRQSASDQQPVMLRDDADAHEVAAHPDGQRAAYEQLDVPMPPKQWIHIEPL